MVFCFVMCNYVLLWLLPAVYLAKTVSSSELLQNSVFKS